MRTLQKENSTLYRMMKIASLVLFLSAAALTQQIAIIANMSVPVSSIDRPMTLDIYSLSTQTWKDGSAITVVTMKGE